MASHHDGKHKSPDTDYTTVGGGDYSSAFTGGWHFWANGNISHNVFVPQGSKNNFWVHIRDQPGNCWDRVRFPFKTGGAVNDVDATPIQSPARPNESNQF